MCILLILMCCLLAFHDAAQAVVIGSESTVSVISTSTLFPSADTDNTMLGFGWFKGGFTFEDQNTSCTFNSVFPVSGTIDMNGGTLYLEKDLVLDNVTQLNGLGTIIGNNHTLSLCTTVTSLPSDLRIIKDLTIKGVFGVSFSSTVTVQGTCKVIGNGNFIDLGTQGAICVDRGSSFELQDTLIKSVCANNFLCVDDTASVILNNTVVEIVGDVHFHLGSIHVINNAKLYGSAEFWYDSAQPCDIDRYSKLSIDGGLTFKIGKQSENGQSPLKFYDGTSIISCANCRLLVSEYGIDLTNGKVELNNHATISTESTDTSRGIILGDGLSEDHDVSLVLGSGGWVVFDRGALVYNNVNAGRFTSESPNACFVRKVNSIFHMATTCTYPTSQLELEFDGTHFPQTTLNPGACLYYNNTQMTIPGYGSGIYKSRKELEASFILDTQDSIYLTTGYLEGIINVVGSGNVIAGSGCIRGAMQFNNANSELFLDINGILRSPIKLNGGKLTILGDVRVCSGNCFASSGTIDLRSNTLTYMFSSTTPENYLDVPLTWSGEHGTISLSENTSLTTTWTIRGSVTINGNGNTLSLESAGQIIVDSNAVLTLKDMRINVLGLNDIRCVDDTGKIILDNVYWIQNDDYIFDKGSLEFKNDVTISGKNHTFTYQSTQTSFIHYDTSVTLDSKLSFSYAPSNGDQRLLVFEDTSSQLILNGATLYLHPGLQLTKGQLKLYQSPCVYSYETSTTRGDGGLTLGNSTSEDDMIIVYADDSTLSIASGSLNYKNVNADSIEVWQSGEVSIASGSAINIFEDMYMERGRLSLFDSSTYAYKAGKEFKGNMVLFGEYNTVEF